MNLNGLGSGKYSIKIKLGFCLAVISLFYISAAHCTEVTFAGFAYSGDSQSISARFPYSKRFEATLGSTGVNGLLQKNLSSIQPQGYTLIPRINNLADRDQAVAVALVITEETVSTEKLGQAYKLFSQIQGQALFFDFKSQTMLRAYPFSFAYLDASMATAPTEAQKDASIAAVFLGKNGKPGILDRFSQALTKATIPINVPRFVQVTKVAISDEAREDFPAEFGKGVAETWVADTFGEAISSKMGIPILPYAKGYAIGNLMPMTVADGTVYNLKLPEPDYEFSVNISKLKKIVYSDTAAGKSLIYGTYASLKLEQPLSEKVYLDGQFKNGEVKVVPVMQVNTDDFPAFEDSIQGLFTKLSGAIAGESSPWLKSAASGNEIEKQIVSTRELLQSCK